MEPNTNEASWNNEPEEIIDNKGTQEVMNESLPVFNISNNQQDQNAKESNDDSKQSSSHSYRHGE